MAPVYTVRTTHSLLFILIKRKNYSLALLCDDFVHTSTRARPPIHAQQTQKKRKELTHATLLQTWIVVLHTEHRNEWRNQEILIIFRYTIPLVTLKCSSIELSSVVVSTTIEPLHNDRRMNCTLILSILVFYFFLFLSYQQFRNHIECCDGMERDRCRRQDQCSFRFGNFAEWMTG